MYSTPGSLLVCLHSFSYLDTGHYPQLMSHAVFGYTMGRRGSLVLCSIWQSGHIMTANATLSHFALPPARLWARFVVLHTSSFMRIYLIVK